MPNQNYDLPLISTQLGGQLGNQLFYIATALGYAYEYNVTPIFPSLNSDSCSEGIIYNRDHIFFRLDSSLSPRPFKAFFKEAKPYNYSKIPFQPDLLIVEGIFQSWKYFDQFRDKILSVFAPSEKILNHINEKYADLIVNPTTVSIHLRARNRDLHNRKIHPTFSLEYYKNAMSHYSSDSTFIIFSDRIEWCKKHFPSLNRKFVFIDDDYIVELFLMSMMKNNIICNSTFSWWAAYLNQNPNKIVVTPDN